MLQHGKIAIGIVWTYAVFYCLKSISAFPVESHQWIVSNDSALQPCPCTDQPAGIVMAHPTDCRAFYTCLGSSNVRYTRCGTGDQLFHPYLGACVQRSKYISFIPSIVPTKDLCKISSVFRSPAAENFDNCHITMEDDSTLDSHSDEDVYIGNNADHSLFVSTNTERVTFERQEDITSAGESNKNESKLLQSSDLNLNRSHDEILVTTSTTTEPIVNLVRPSSRGQSVFNTLKPALSTQIPMTGLIECRIAKILVQQFPDPCQANITCANGITFRIKNCQNSFSLASL